MGLKGSSPFPQKSTIKRYTFYTFIPDFFNRYFNTIFPPTPMSSKWSLPWKIFDENAVYISGAPLSVICPTHVTFLTLNHPNNTR